ncbi:hypothetical protein B0I72DRAFT_112085 [Yarrowia lipolytica]|uniref:YALI0B02002p n=2 Tax=Yarrowia lipolytica TaxID=4952 RepID=Q6CG05_YARLI|nr:YALI0B02002p [Yarrowia lipolytica CLIB122]AOW01100.1 hypothetical protein YALI1_B02991g [Yarrowia lipolytica]KAB8281063.1 hypothetical protein BKA91DRAFT_116566 [Yarrowia lipolytica]KAE8172946.1 hypothetical protein BKA90DRAFT_161945 [Yarrowia lipolytica]KAJ8051999.1 hypothetical protein LXG23DRAFT_25172 [Yarrowia lipolytica]RDW32732.1 hypothetical protein B0I72DRAFT_112085 [Yarrowia lipolytica]|eukprot:XP_500407.1 YALI0B02002p [Yarrowia lipolytica CLIB122]
MGWGQRTFSFSSYSYTGVGQAHPSQPDVNSMARAAASSVGSNPNERANSGLSSAAAAAAIRHHSLTSSTSQPNLQQGRNGSMRGGREGRTSSLLGGRTNSLMGGRKSSLRGQNGGFASVSGTNASGRAPDLIEEESGSVGDLPNVRKGKRGTRTYSLTTPFEGFEDGGIGQGASPAISPNNSITSVSSPGRTSSLRHSLRGAPSSGSLRRGSMTSTTTNTERTHSLTSTTTTIKRMGSFHVITTKTQEVPAGGKPPARSRLSQGGTKPAYQTRDLLTQQRQEREARQQQLNKANRAKAQKEQRLRQQQQVPVVKEPEPPASPIHYASSVLSYESDLNTVSEYPESSLTSPNGSVGSGKRHMPPPRTLSPMKPALKMSESPRNSFTQDTNSLSPHSSIDSPSRTRKQRVSFSSESESNFIAQESQRQKALLSLPQQQPAKQPLQPRPKQYSPGTVVPVSNNQLASNGLPKVVKTPERQSQLAQEQAHQQALKHAKLHTPQQQRKRESQQYQPKRESQQYVQQHNMQQQHVPKTKKAHAHPAQPRQAAPAPPSQVLSPMLSHSESEEDLSMFQDAHEHLGKSVSKTELHRTDVQSPVPVSLVNKDAVDHVEAKTEPETGHEIEPPIVTTIGDVQEAQDEAAAYNEVMGDVEEPVTTKAAVPDSPGRFGSGVFGSVANAVSGAVAAADQFGKQMQFNPSESTLESVDNEGDSIYEDEEEVVEEKQHTLQPPAQLHVNTDAANASSDMDDLPTPKLASSQFSSSPSSPSMRRNYRQYALGGMPVPSSSDIDAVSPSNHKFSPSSGSIGSNYTSTGAPGAGAGVGVTPSHIPDYSVDVERPRDSVYADSNYGDESQYGTTASQFVSHVNPEEEEEEEEDVPVKAFGNLKTSPRLGASEGPGSVPALASSSPKAVVHPPTGPMHDPAGASSAAPVPVEYPTLDPGSPNAPRQPSPAKKVGFAEEEEVVEHVPHPEGPMDDNASIESDSSWRRERRAGRGGINSTNGGVSDEGYRLTLRDDAGYGRDVPQEPYSMRAPQFRKPKEEFREQSPARQVPQEPQYGFAAVREQQNRGGQQQPRASLQPQARRGSVPTQPALVRSNSASSFDRGSRSNSMSAFRMGSMREPRTTLRQDVPPVPAMPSGMSAGPAHVSRFSDTDSEDEGAGIFSGANTSPRKKRGMRFFSSSKEEMRPTPAPASPSEPGLGKKLFSSTKTLKKQQAEAQGGYAQFTQQPGAVPEPQMIESTATAGSAGKQKKFGKLRRVFRLD